MSVVIWVIKMDKKEEFRKYYLDIFSFKKTITDRDDFEFLKSEVDQLARNKDITFAMALDLIAGMLDYEFENNNAKGALEKKTRALTNFELFRTMAETENHDESKNH